MAQYLTTFEVAHELRVSSVRVLQLAESGRLQVALRTKLGRLFDPRAVARLKRQRERNAQVLKARKRLRPEITAEP